MYNDIITLVAEEISPDEFGDMAVMETTREVFAQLKSITQTEFYQAQASGLKPEVKFLLADYLDYHGELIVRYAPYELDKVLEYTVLRTYRDGNGLELVCKKGVERGACS